MNITHAVPFVRNRQVQWSASATACRPTVTLCKIASFGSGTDFLFFELKIGSYGSAFKTIYLWYFFMRTFCLLLALSCRQGTRHLRNRALRKPVAKSVKKSLNSPIRWLCGFLKSSNRPAYNRPTRATRPDRPASKERARRCI